MALSREDVRFGVVPGIARLGEVLANAFSRQQEMTMNLELEKLRLGAKQAEGEKPLPRGTTQDMRKETTRAKEELRTDLTPPPRVDEFGQKIPDLEPEGGYQEPSLHPDPLGGDYGFMNFGPDWQAVGEKEERGIQHRTKTFEEQEMPASLAASQILGEAVNRNVVYPEEIQALAPGLQRDAHALALLEKQGGVLIEAEEWLGKEQRGIPLAPHEERAKMEIERAFGLPLAEIPTLPQRVLMQTQALIQQSQQRRKNEMANAVPGTFVTAALRGMNVPGVEVSDSEARFVLSRPGSSEAPDAMAELEAYAAHVADMPDSNNPISFAGEQAVQKQYGWTRSGPPDMEAQHQVRSEGERRFVMQTMHDELKKAREEGAAPGSARFVSGRVDTNLALDRYKAFSGYWNRHENYSKHSLTHNQASATALILAYMPSMGETEALNIIRADENQLWDAMFKMPEAERRVVQTALSISGVRHLGSGNLYQTTRQHEERKREEFRSSRQERVMGIANQNPAF